MVTKKVIKLKRFKVKVTSYYWKEPLVYTIIAADQMDARIMAWILDGGFPWWRLEINAEDIELVEKYTEVLK